MRSLLLSILLFLSFASMVHADFNDDVSKHCADFDGVEGYVLEDRSTVDCVTEDYAVKFCTAKEWRACLSDALRYSAGTGKRALIAVVANTPQDTPYISELSTVIKENSLQIDVILVRKSLTAKVRGLII